MEVSSVIDIPNVKNPTEDEKPKKCFCNWRKTLRNKVPIITWLPQYKLTEFLHDLLAGFTVALTEIPQSMAYAAVAGLPLQYGLYSSFMGGFVYAIFGSCKAINMGSTSLMALLIQSHVTDLGIAGSVFMSFVGGIMILLLGLINLGFIIDFFSYPVMAGFTSAAAVTIASSQMKNFLGISGQANEFLESWQSVGENIAQTNKWDAILGTISLALLFFLKEISVFGGVTGGQNTSKTSLVVKRSIFFLSIAKNAIVVILGMTTAYLLEQNGYDSLKLTGEVAGGFPEFVVPPPFNDHFKSFVDMVKEFGVSLVFIPLIAILETIAIAKVFSRGRTIDASQEMIALGIANILGSFVQSMPVTGSFTRTAVNNASGAKTNVAAIFTGLTIMVALQFLTATFYYIPKATLASVIMCAMFYLFEFEAFPLLWKNSKFDFITFVVTLLSCVFISLEYGIIIGIGTNLIFVLYSVARPRLQLETKKLPNYSHEVYLVTPPGTIHFPAAEYLSSTILNHEGALVIINGEYIDSMDSTVAKSIGILATKVAAKNQELIFLNFKPSVRQVCVGINKKLGEQFKTGDLEDIIEGCDSMTTI